MEAMGGEEGMTIFGKRKIEVAKEAIFDPIN